MAVDTWLLWFSTLPIIGRLPASSISQSSKAFPRKIFHSEIVASLEKFASSNTCLHMGWKRTTLDEFSFDNVRPAINMNSAMSFSPMTITRLPWWMGISRNSSASYLTAVSIRRKYSCWPIQRRCGIFYNRLKAADISGSELRLPRSDHARWQVTNLVNIRKASR